MAKITKETIKKEATKKEATKKEVAKIVNDKIEEENKELKNEVNELKKQIELLLKAQIASANNTVVDDSKKVYTLHTPCLYGVTMYSRLGLPPVSIAEGMPVKITKGELETFLREANNLNNVRRGLIFSEEEDMYRDLNISIHNKIDKDTLKHLILTEDADTVRQEILKLTENNTCDPVIHSIIMTIARLYSEDEEVLNSSFVTRQTLQTVLKCDFDSLINIYLLRK